MTKSTVHRRLVSVVAAALLLAPMGSPFAQATSASSTSLQGRAQAVSPFRLVGTPTGQLYASGTISARRALLTRSPAAGSSGPTSRAVQRAAAPPASHVRPLAAPNPVQASLTSAPDNHVAGFNGLAESDQASSGAEPANSTVAVGPDQVVQVANLVMRISNRAGGPAVTATIPTFFEVTTGFFDRDPRVIYDSLHGRFVATEVSWDCTADAHAEFGHGYIDLAVSETTDPTGIWDLYFWGYNDLVPDDPSLGTSTDKLAITSNLFQMSQGGSSDGAACADPNVLATLPYGGDILIANWADAIANKSSTLPSTEYAAHVTGVTPGPTAMGVRAALQAPATSSTLFVVGRSVVDDSGVGTHVNDVIVTTFTGTTTKTTSVAQAGSWTLTGDGIVAPFANPTPPAQPGSPGTIVNALGPDPQDALWQAGELSWTTTNPCTPTGDSSIRDCVRVSQVATPSATTEPTARQDFLIGRNGFDSYMPGIGMSADGTLEVVYSQSSTAGSNYPSSYQQYQRSTDPSNALSAPVRLAAGTGTYPGAEWGTYVGLGQDPQVASVVWQANAYSVGASYWSTYVDQLGRTTGTTYVPIVPVRILDSRFGTGLSGLSGKFVASVARTFSVAGLGSIPAAAVAVTGNVTVTRQNAAGYVAVTPTAQANPPSSTLNFPLTGDRANNVTVPLSSAGTLSMTFKAGAGRTTDLVFDVTGYFLPDDSAATYHPVTPTRLLDSRFGTGQPGGTPAKFLAGVPQTFTVGGGLTIPVAATAITGNVTVTRQTKAGYLAITPDPTASPPASTLNFPLADDRANGFTAPLNTSHQLSIVYITATGAKTDVVLDVTGYYLADLTGLHFYPLNPGRIMDTRPGVANSGLTGPFGSSVPRDLATVGHWAIPTGAQALTGNLTVTGQTSSGYATITPTPDANPPTSTLNFPLGDNRANGVTVPLSGTGSLWLVFKGGSGRMTNLILDVTGYFQ